MKVSGVKSRVTNRTGKAKSASTKSSTSTPVTISPITESVGPGSVDSVEVGDHGATIDLIKNLVAGTPDIRVDEVERIVRQMKNGKYKINFEKVAEGFIKEAIITEISRKPRKN